MEVKNTKVIVINNQKGGQHKSTISHHLGVVLAESELKVCIIDADYTQGSLTKMVVGSVEGTGQKGLMHILLDNRTESHEVIVRTNSKNLDIIPSELKVMNRSIDIGLVIAQDEDRITKLKNFVDKNLRGKYDFIIIDTPPKDDLVLRNTLVASDFVIIPTLAADASTEQVPRTAQSIIDVKQNSNPNIELLGILLVQTDGRAKITREARNKMKKLVGEAVFDTEIRKNTKFESLMRDKLSIFDVAERDQVRGAKGAVEYSNLGAEVLKRLNNIEAKKSNKIEQEVSHG